MRIAFEHVSFSYDSGERERREEARYALDDVSFDLEAGAFLGIVGPTGSGKSTLLRHLNGLVSPTRGRVLIDGSDLTDKQTAHDARRRIGIVFQYPEQQLFAATVYDDVAFGPKNFGCSHADVDARVREALEQVGLPFDDVRNASPFDLSGGQQRRVALAGVLACRPETLALDEPCAGLDPCAHAELLKLIDEVRAQGRSIIMVSHVMEDIARLADSVLVLDEGAVWALGSPDEVLSDAEELARIGLRSPEAHLLAGRLRTRGFTLERALYNEQTLAEDIIANVGAQPIRPTRP